MPNVQDRRKWVRSSTPQTCNQGGIVRRESILAIWVGGFVLAVALYLIGPDRFFDAYVDLIDGIDTAFRNLVAALGAKTYGVIRAFAIAIYVVFAVLAFMASNRGHRGMGALVVVTAVFLVLVWHPYDPWPAPISRWIAALVLVVVGAVVMSQRLTVTPLRQPGPPPPYPPGGRAP